MMPAVFHSQPPEQPIVRIAEIDIDPQRIEQYKVALKEEIEASIRLEPGVLSLNAATRKDDPCHVTLFETYASQTAYAAHSKSAHFLKYKAVTSEMIRSLKLHEMEPILLGSKAAEHGPG